MMELRVKYPSETIERTARKPHACAGPHDGKTRRQCSRPIAKGEPYVEYMAEAAPAYASGTRYHWFCAVTQGLVEVLS